ncbi:sugar ABC transporter permease [Streptomyces rectiverticillatus]|uniref:carbohydrate ABC transporter permease n=1 Tax=Streptomyces rectiverticillatus TaxID=173860 RepID=UPI001FEB64D6|nr:sugar ABC transporter permease [Streptomyces rectiverticillatus]QLE74947.1 sugar ABC transporter permease [Streptomyces rectiverticillatus]
MTGVKRVRTHRAASPWLFLLPGLGTVAAFNLYPFLTTLHKAFTDARTLTPGSWVGLRNFRELLEDEQFWVALRNSGLYVVLVVPFTVLLPLLLALLVQKRIPGVAFFRSAFYTPVVASVVVVALIWEWMLDDRGLVNAVLRVLGAGPVSFLGDEWLLLFSAMALTVWKGLGYYMIIYLAALANVPRELHEAAAVDGAGPLRRFTAVTVPAVRSTMVLVGALSSVAAFKVFSEVYLLAGPTGGPAGQDTTLVMLLQRTGTGLNGRVGYSSAISLIVFAVALVLMLLVLRADRRDREDSQDRQGGRDPKGGRA